MKKVYIGIAVIAILALGLAEKFEGLDRYSGETLEQFYEKVDELSDGIKSK